MSSVSYGVKIKNLTNSLAPTIKIYREAVNYLVNISLLHYDDIKEFSTNQAMSVMEQMVYSTAKRTARNHGYELRFVYKLPSGKKKYVKDVNVKKVVGVDLGLNKDAVCSVVRSDGTVLRGRTAGYHNNEMCRFISNKQYNCDLSAAKNIAARLILRSEEKSMSETAWLQAQTKVSELCTRTKCTLATVIRLSAVVTAS